MKKVLYWEIPRNHVHFPSGDVLRELGHPARGLVYGSAAACLDAMEAICSEIYQCDPRRYACLHDALLTEDTRRLGLDPSGRRRFIRLWEVQSFRFERVDGELVPFFTARHRVAEQILVYKTGQIDGVPVRGETTEFVPLEDWSDSVERKGWGMEPEARQLTFGDEVFPKRKEVTLPPGCTCQNPPPYPGAEGCWGVRVDCPVHGDEDPIEEEPVQDGDAPPSTHRS